MFDPHFLLSYLGIDAGKSPRSQRKWCWPTLHEWGRYDLPQVVTNSSGLLEVGQRRECARCGAVAYRRVTIANG